METKGGLSEIAPDDEWTREHSGTCRRLRGGASAEAGTMHEAVGFSSASPRCPLCGTRDVKQHEKNTGWETNSDSDSEVEQW